MTATPHPAREITPGTCVRVNQPAEGQEWSSYQRSFVGQTGKADGINDWGCVVIFPDGKRVGFALDKLTPLPAEPDLAAQIAALSERVAALEAAPLPAQDAPTAGEGTYWRRITDPPCIYRVKDGAVEFLQADTPGDVWETSSAQTPADLLDTARFEPYSPRVGEWIERVKDMPHVRAGDKCRIERIHGTAIYDAAGVWIGVTDDLGTGWLPCAPASETVAAGYHFGQWVWHREHGLCIFITHDNYERVVIAVQQGQYSTVCSPADLSAIPPHSQAVVLVQVHGWPDHYEIYSETTDYATGTHLTVILPRPGWTPEARDV